MTDDTPKKLFHHEATRRTVQRDVDDEMRFHLEQRIDDLVARGMSADDARELAVREFGDVKAARAELASMDRRRVRKFAATEWIASVGQDIKFAARSLRKRPGFAAAVLLTLALGIGANAAIFSVVEAVLIKPLPFSRPDRLVHLWEVYQSRVDNRSEASYPDYLDWRARNRSFSDMAGYYAGAFVYGAEHPQIVRAGKTTANFFDVLGVHAELGRTFAEGEDAVGAPRRVLLGYGFWQRGFAGDRSVIGRTITLDGTNATIIGVLPKDFQFARVGNVSIWAPIDRLDRSRQQRGMHWLNIVARLKDGVTLRTASLNMSAIMGQLAREYPPTNNGRDAQVIALRDQLIGSVRPLVVLLYGAVAVMLLVACANVANLLLMRGADRRREVAVRIALGAGRGRLVRQLMTESLLLAVLGGAAGLVVAHYGIHTLVGVIPPGQRPPALADVGVNGPVAIYSCLISVVAGVLFGLVPALREARPQMAEVLKQGVRGSARAGAVRDALVVGEVALTMVLMSGAALFGRSLVKLMSIQLGFQAEHLTIAGVFLPDANYVKPELRVATFDQIVSRARALPGVDAAGLVTKLPLDWGNSVGFDIVGQAPTEPGKEPTASYRTSSPGYFSALEIPLSHGRDFGAGDGVANAPPAGIVNRAFAEAYFKNGNAIGQSVVMGGGRDTIHIVGQVGDVPIGNIDEHIPPTLYVPFAQDPETYMSIAIRSQRDVGELARELTRIVEETAPGAGVVNPMAMDQLITNSSSVFMRRFPLLLIGAFAAATLVLALIGVYGVVSYSVAQRTRELGIRVALGAQTRSLVMLVVRHGAWMAAAGVTIGIASSLLLGRFVAGMLYGIGARDPVTLALVSIVLGVAAVSATIVPAKRATKVDPAVALQAE
ncbi:MAG TPA: ABC transporter permease [Gemmatimonadaceae bacterium]|jgi:predicted permease|nr:ABC transporter permease [Gemmatimonadaceae bacterium]